MQYKHLSSVASVVFLGQVARAAPATVLEKIQDLHARHVPCMPGGTPILYQEYHADQCPPVNPMDATGGCGQDYPQPAQGIWDRPEDLCTRYCEVRQTFYYDEEKPLDQPFCHGPMSCTVGENKQSTITWNIGVNEKFLEAIKLGVTGGYSDAEATTQINTKTINLGTDECGYFTFLPIMHGSCGSVTESHWRESKCQDFTTTPNICSQQAYRSEDGKYVQGDTIFVKTNCADRSRLPMGDQDKAYQHDGVALPQDAYTAFMAHHTGSGAEGVSPLNND